jgi:hypothetical protein
MKPMENHDAPGGAPPTHDAPHAHDAPKNHMVAEFRERLWTSLALPPPILVPSPLLRKLARVRKQP